GHRLARLFTPAVMVFFMLLLGAQLTSIFFKGMLGLPFGIADTAAMPAFSAGSTFVLLEKYSARAFWDQVRKYQATVTECIPMM
ncbi:hypothetical protein MJL33_34810, partial [Salmonella enterica subsp. enterica serovar Kentucky]|nr:hypothetical protein [Salmonella enterica subsp. enterica serovar Kentucky]